MPILPRILLATPCAKDAERLRSLLAGDAEVLTASGPVEAERLLAGRGLAAVIADDRLADGSARVLADRFLKRSARGRAILLASLEHPDVLLGLDRRSPRLEVVFRPWNDWQLRTCLLGQALEATGTG
jgi:hypothetical protein